MLADLNISLGWKKYDEELGSYLSMQEGDDVPIS